MTIAEVMRSIRRPRWNQELGRDQMARPLSKTYDPANPFVAERHDQEDGSIVYEIWDHRPDTYRRLCICSEDYVDEDGDVEPPTERGQTKKDADMIATALNMVFGKRKFSSAKLRTIPKRAVHQQRAGRRMLHGNET